ncbi:MAG: hypothetical protein ACJ8EA_23370, partial [Xanthobacteraceae bacterium]
MPLSILKFLNEVRQALQELQVGGTRELPRIEDMYVTMTRDIEVTVVPRFLPERSSPQQGH